MDSIFFQLDHISTEEDLKKLYKTSAKDFIKSFEGLHCRAFLMALRDEIDNKLGNTNENP